MTNESAGWAPWIQLLLVEYAGTKRTQEAIALLEKVYDGEDNDLMHRAAVRYLKHETFFPTVSAMRPYVDYEHETRPYMQARVTWASDEEMLRTEQRLGTMPPDDELHASYWPVVLKATGLEDELDEPLAQEGE